MEMIFRNAVKKDFAALKKIFRAWADCDPEMADLLESASSRIEAQDLRCRLVEAGKSISRSFPVVRRLRRSSAVGRAGDRTRRVGTSGG